MTDTQENAKEQTNEAVTQATDAVLGQQSSAAAIDDSRQKAQNIQSAQYICQGEKSILRSVRNIPAVYRATRDLGKGRFPAFRDTVKSVYGAYRVGRGMADIGKGMTKVSAPQSTTINAPSLTQITDPNNLAKSYEQTKELAEQLRSLKSAQSQLLKNAKENVNQANQARLDTRVQQLGQGTRAFARSGVTMASGLADVAKGHSVKGTLKGMLSVSDMVEGTGSTLKATLGHLSDIGAAMQNEQNLDRQANSIAQVDHSIESTLQQQALQERALATKGMG